MIPHHICESRDDEIRSQSNKIEFVREAKLLSIKWKKNGKKGRTKNEVDKSFHDWQYFPCCNHKNC